MNKAALAVMDDVLSMPFHGRHAIDGGANIGVWAKAMAGKFEKVIAFEPHPGVANMLRINTQGVPRIRIRQKALGWVNGHKVKMGMRLPNKNATTRIGLEGEDAETATLDLECENLDIAFIKLDLEGFEYHALRGGERTLKGNRPLLLIEEKDGLSEHFGIPTGAAVEWLESIGMRVLKRYKIDVLMGWT